MSDLRKAAEMALEALIGAEIHDPEAVQEPIQVLRQALSQPEQEPVWSAEKCDRVVKTLRYIQGIAERGEGRAMRDDETLEQFVLGYVKKLEQPEQEPVECMCGICKLGKREWQGLTDDEIGWIWHKSPPDSHSYARAIEAKLKEKNT